MQSSSLQELEHIPGVGKTIARNMHNFGIHSIDDLRAYPNIRVVMRPSEKFEAKAAGQKGSQAWFTPRRERFWPITQASGFAAGRNRAGYLDKLLRAPKLSSFMIDSASLRPLQSTDVCFTYSTGYILNTNDCRLIWPRAVKMGELDG
jgi:hypothetical protein